MTLDLSLYPEGTRRGADGRLMIGDVPLADIAQRYGTPAFIIDEGALRQHARTYLSAFRSRHAASQVLFAAKSFPSASVIRVLAQEGLGVDTAAEGELRMAVAAGADPASMVSHGNAKTDADIRAALNAAVRFIVIDNLDDIERIARLAPADSAPVPVLLRVSPSVSATTHEAMATGHDASKFGIPSAQVEATIAAIRTEPRLDLQGLHAHVGSQLTDLDQYDAEVAALAEFERFGVYDLGGGLGVRYTSADQAPTVEQYADRVVSAVHRHLGDQVHILVEPGRSMIANQAVTLYRAVTVKRGVRTHLAVDGGMGDNLEVSLYGQPFQPSVIDRSGESETVDVVGRHCEQGDWIARDVVVTRPRVGDLVVVPVTGAYCFTMANNYNTALRPPVIFCRDGQARIGVRRETFEDLMRREQDLSADG